MGPLPFLLFLSLALCRSNGFHVFSSSMFKTISSQTLNLDTALQENTITDLGLKLIKKFGDTSAKNCKEACKQREYCTRFVHCKSVPDCLPGTFCTGFREEGTCYLAGNSGEDFQAAGECTISKEVEHGVSGSFFTDKQVANLFAVPEEKSVSLADEFVESPVLNATIPNGCLEEPTYANHGAVEKRRLHRPGYPVVIEYECGQKGQDEYTYLVGSREALCNDQGEWTLPAMVCVPTNCYLVSSNGVGGNISWYVGAVDHGHNGPKCQRWKNDSPHHHKCLNKLKGSFPGDTSVAGAKCRTLHGETVPWCYTTDPDVRWRHCDVPECKETISKCGHPPFIYSTKPVDAKLIGQQLHVTYECHDQLTYESGGKVSTCDMETGEWTWSDLRCHSTKCFFYEREIQKRGVYGGDVSTTFMGKTCQRWDSQAPHTHRIEPTYFPVSNLAEAGNTCRDFKENVGGAPWCYTTDPNTRWQYCTVPECNLQ